MTPQFTTPCFVRVEDADKRKEICEKLDPVGYKIKVDYTDDINPTVVASKLGILHDASCIESPEFINCGTNIDLFLALAGMRSDTDMGQHFIDERDGSMNFSEDDDIGLSAIVYRKATAAEIVQHFTKTVQSSKIEKK